jgi:hypothetical protein
MKLALHEGPVHAPALFAFAPRRSGAVPYARRRPIGLGARTVLLTDPASVARPRPHRTPPRKKAMKRTTLFISLLLAVTASVAAMGISAAVDSPRTLMSRDDYRDALRGIDAATRDALGQCRPVELASREVCKAKARADERVRKAELQARYYGTVAAAADVEVARVKAKYDIARAECGARASGERLECLRVARESRTRELHAKADSPT